MRYFVTGVTGFIGGVLTRRLLEQGHTVVTVARSPEKAGDLTALGVQVHRGDIIDRETMREPMRGADGVFHLAAWYKVGARAKDRQTAQTINVEGTRNVLELARDLNIPKTIYTSTLAVNSDTHGKLVDETYHFEGQHISEYDRTKWEAHARVAEPLMRAGLPLVIVMPGVVYGPGDTSSVRTTLIDYLQRKLPVLPARTAYSWAHVDDIVTAHLLAMSSGRTGEKYIIAGPTHTLIDAMHIAERITGVPAPRLIAPPFLLRANAALLQLLGDREVMGYTAEGLRIIAGVTYIGDNAKAVRELGYRPRPLEDGLRETLEHEMRLLGIGG